MAIQTGTRPTLIPLARFTAIVTAMLLLTVLIVTTSRAAFTDTTENAGNSFASGSVIITDDDGGSAMFAATAMTPGEPVIECIALTYSGSLVPADVRMYGVSAGVLATYLDTTVEIGSGGSFGDCTGFTASSTLYSGTLANFSATHTDWASGLATFTAPANPTSQTLRFTVDVQNDPAAMTQSATATFTWEAQD